LFSCILSNKHRIKKLLIFILIIVLLSLYSHVKRPESSLTFNECLQNPEKYDRHVIYIRNEAKIGKVFDNKFEIIQGENKFMAFGSSPDLRENDYITAKATFFKKGYIKIEKSHVHKYRRIKIAISVIPVLLIIFLFLREYRFNLINFHFIQK